LIAVFSGSVGDVREKLEDSTKQVLDVFPGSAVVGRGLKNSCSIVQNLIQQQKPNYPNSEKKYLAVPLPC